MHGSDVETARLADPVWRRWGPLMSERAWGTVREDYSAHSWMRWRYVYPQAAFPYADLIEVNGRRSRTEPEYELLDTGVFAHGWWDIEAQYAKYFHGDDGRGPGASHQTGWTGLVADLVIRISNDRERRR